MVGLMGYAETKAERDALEQWDYEQWQAKQDADEFCRMKAALSQIANGNWSNVKPDSQAASDLAQIVAEMQRIASEAIQ